MNDMKNPPPRELSTEEIEKVFKTVEIPACPAIVVEAMKEAQKDVPDIVRLAKTISADVGMSAITIKLANSSLFRAGAAVTNVRKALERLGTMNVVCVVVASALRSSMKGPSSPYIDRFWSKNSALALAAGMIARRHYGISPDAAYTYALFHDAGIPLMLQRFPEYERVLEGCQESGKLLIGAEDSYFPCTHPVIGSLLVRNWGLPSNLIQAIRLHHEPDVYDLPDTTLSGSALSLIACVHVAEHIISELLSEKDYEVGDALFERGIAHLGIAQEDMEQLREDIVAAMNESKH